MKRPNGFTLIEILVVISIIAVLVGILLPALGSAREAAVDTRCKVRLGQIILAQSMYATDHGAYTTIWNAGDDGEFSESGPAPAKTNLEAYLSLSSKELEDVDSVLQCPSVAEEDLRIFDNRLESSRPSSIGTNSAMNFQEWEFVPERVPSTSKIIVVAEQAVEPYEEVLSSDGVTVLKIGAKAYWRTVSTHDPTRGYRHGGTPGNNVAMADGHVTHLDHEGLKHKSGHWFWWDNSLDPTANTGGAGGCGCPSLGVDPEMAY